MADEAKPEVPDVSPTGKPLVSPKLAPYFAAAAAVCTVVAGAAKIPALHMPDEVFGYAALLALIFGTLLGTTPGLRGKAPVLLLVLGLGFSSCSATNAVLGTGQVVTAAADEYHTAVGLFDQALAAGVITQEQFHTFHIFSDYFEKSYNLSAEGWELARQMNDAVRAQRLLVDIQDLLDQLRNVVAPVLELIAQTKAGGPS